MMIDVHSLEVIGRKELQALAKEHGIKANQKSAILRDELLAKIKDVTDQTEGPINANEENLPDATTENTLAEEPGRDSEEVIVDNGAMEDSTPAEKSPRGREMANIADDIGLFSPDNMTEGNEHNDTVQNEYNVSPGEIASSIEVANVDDQAWGKSVDEKDYEVESPSSISDVVNVADDRINLSSPDNTSEENAHDDTVQGEHNMSAEDTASSITVVKIDEQAREKPVDEKDLEKESPSSSAVVNVTIVLSSSDKASKERNEHNDTARGAHNVLTGETHSSIEVANINEQAQEKPVEERDKEESSPYNSDVANVADDRIGLSSPENTSEEKAHSDTVLSEHNMSTEETASSIGVGNVDEKKAREKSVDEKDQEEELPRSNDVVNVTIENASEENKPNNTVQGEHNMSGKRASSSEVANIDEQAWEKPVEQRDQDKSLYNNIDVSHVADDRIGLSYPDNMNEEKAPTTTVQSEHCMSTEETASSIEVTNVDQQAWEKPVDEKDQEESPRSSDAVIFTNDRIDLSSPDNASEENEHNNTIQGENNMSTEKRSSSSEVANMGKQAWEKQEDERKQEDHISDAANVTDDSIGLSSPDKSKENAHSGTVQNKHYMSTEETASSIEVVNINDQAWGKTIDEKDQEDESPSSSEMSAVADDIVELSTPDNVSEENVHNDTVQSKDNIRAEVPASSGSRNEARIKDQGMENSVKQIDGYGELLHSGLVRGEKTTHVSFSKGTKFALVEEANRGYEKNAMQNKSTEAMIIASANKEFAVDCHEPKESCLVDGDSGNDTSHSGIADAARSTIATIGRQHEEQAVQMKAHSSGPACKIASKYYQKRPLSKGEQMSFGFKHKETKPLPSVPAISSSQEITQKNVPRKAKTSLPGWKIAAEDFRKRPASSGKAAMVMNETKPRAPLQKGAACGAGIWRCPSRVRQAGRRRPARTGAVCRSRRTPSR